MKENWASELRYADDKGKLCTQSRYANLIQHKGHKGKYWELRIAARVFECNFILVRLQLRDDGTHSHFAVHKFYTEYLNVVRSPQLCGHLVTLISHLFPVRLFSADWRDLCGHCWSLCHLHHVLCRDGGRVAHILLSLHVPSTAAFAILPTANSRQFAQRFAGDCDRRSTRLLCSAGRKSSWSDQELDPAGCADSCEEGCVS